ncbi:MAG: hypothetical protein IAG13_38875 [Deltaproteobacteria bacterium]|nr:hypothetical protein [Nannocystaceae bacterium]
MLVQVPFVPVGMGRAALGELDRVPWAELAHAYGTGVRHPPLASLCTAITAYAESNSSTRAHAEAIAEAGETTSELELGDPPRPTAAGPEQWVSHPKFGLGLIVAREDAKARVRFTDGTERMLLARVLLPAEAPTPD